MPSQMTETKMTKNFTHVCAPYGSVTIALEAVRASDYADRVWVGGHVKAVQEWNAPARHEVGAVAWFLVPPDSVERGEHSYVAG